MGAGKKKPSKRTGASVSPKGDSQDPIIPPMEIPTPDQVGESSDPLNADLDHQLLYRGASGQMAVLSEFLYRLINVAVPEVDIGDDVFVVREKDEAVIRVQVKYAQAETQKNGSYVAQFALPWEQFDRPDDTPALVYVLAVRHKDRWTDFIVIRRSTLRDLQAEHGFGSVAKKETIPISLRLRLVFTEADVKGKGDFSLQGFRNAFDPWPPALADRPG